VRFMFFVPLFLLADVASAQTRYPLIFESFEQSAEYGIIAVDATSSDRRDWKTLANKCPSFGDGSIMISLSDELRKFMEEQGFSLLTACLGFQSEIFFHPETGERLATYTTKGRLQYSAELPLSLPRCFAGGHPYADCKWNYSPFTGVKAGSRSPFVAPWTEEWVRREYPKYYDRPIQSEDISRAIHQLLHNKRVADRHCPVQELRGMKNVEICLGAIYQVDKDSLQSPQSVVGLNSTINAVAYSPDLKDGYGYALNIQEGAGGSGNPAVVKAGVRGTIAKSRISLDELRSIWKPSPTDEGAKGLVPQKRDPR
jgi:hypothetical protein